MAAFDPEVPAEVPAEVRFGDDSKRTFSGSSHHALTSASSKFQGAAMGRYDELNQVLMLELITTKEARVRFTWNCSARPGRRRR